MSRFTTVRLDGRDLEGSLERKLAHLVGSRPNAIALVFPGEARVGGSLVGAIARAAQALGTLRELVLVHPGSSVGFLASSVGLQVPDCEVRGERDLAALEGGPAQPRRLPSRSAPRVVDLRTVSLTDAFGRAAAALRDGEDRAILLLNPNERPPPGLADVLARELLPCEHLRELVLVHPSAVLRFVASSAGLRLPHIELRAVRQAVEG